MKYTINEEQYRNLIIKKKQDKIANKILEKIQRIKKNLNEGILIEEGITTVLKEYLKKNLLTTPIIRKLLANNINEEQLAKAGIPSNKIRILQF